METSKTKKKKIKKDKVYFFIPELEVALFYVIIIVIALIIAIIIPIFQKLPFFDNFLAAFLATLIISLLSTNIIKKGTLFISNVKRCMYKKLVGSIYKENTLKCFREVAANIVKVFYYHNREILPSQQQIIDDVLRILNNVTDHTKNEEKIIWIYGEPFTGKTTTILNLLTDLITKKQHRKVFNKLNRKIIYLDLSHDNFIIDDLHNNYQAGLYENQLLIIDNLHKV